MRASFTTASSPIVTLRISTIHYSRSASPTTYYFMLSDLHEIVAMAWFCGRFLRILPPAGTGGVKNVRPASSLKNGGLASTRKIPIEMVHRLTCILLACATYATYQRQLLRTAHPHIIASGGSYNHIPHVSQVSASTIMITTPSTRATCCMRERYYYYHNCCPQSLLFDVHQRPATPI